jgi:hypothetical protein
MFEFLTKANKQVNAPKEFTHLGLRIFDKSRTNIMIRKYKKTKVWTIPNIEVKDSNKGIEYHIEEILSILKPHMSFKLISILPIIRHECESDVWDSEKKLHIPTIFKSFIYEIQYDGVIYKSIPESLDSQFYETLWVRPPILAKMSPLNRLTSVLAHMMEKEICLS